MEILFVTWDGGGNVPPALRIATELVHRGHRVRFLGHPSQREALERAGFEVAEPTRARPFTAADPQSPMAMLRMFGDRGLGRDALDARGQADLVVVDCFLLGVMDVLRRVDAPYVVLEHLFDGYFRGSFLRGPMGLGLRLLGVPPGRELAAARTTLTAALPALDPAGSSPPAGVRFVGPVVEYLPPDRTEPAVLVSLSSFGYPGMADCLQRLLDATAGLPARIVVTTGPQLDPAALRTGANHEVHRFVPHEEVMPQMSLVVTHGGHGTVMRALAHDLPVAVMPLHPFADHRSVGAAVRRAGAGTLIGRRWSSDRLRRALQGLLAEGPHREAAASLGAAIRALPGATNAADEIEGLVGTTAGRP